MGRREHDQHYARRERRRLPARSHLLLELPTASPGLLHAETGALARPDARGPPLVGVSQLDTVRDWCLERCVCNVLKAVICLICPAAGSTSDGRVRQSTRKMLYPFSTVPYSRVVCVESSSTLTFHGMQISGKSLMFGTLNFLGRSRDASRWGLLPPLGKEVREDHRASRCVRRLHDSFSGVCECKVVWCCFSCHCRRLLPAARSCRCRRTNCWSTQALMPPSSSASTA